MSNKATLKPFKKGESRTREAGRKGGKNKKGHKSLVKVMNEILASGDIDIYTFVKSQMVSSMKGNSGMARILWEYREGKVTDKMEMTELKPPEKITIEFVEAKKNESTDTVST